MDETPDVEPVAPENKVDEPPDTEQRSLVTWAATAYAAGKIVPIIDGEAQRVADRLREWATGPPEDSAPDDGGFLDEPGSSTPES